MKRNSVGHNRQLVETVGVSKEEFVAVTVRLVKNTIYFISILSNSIKQDLIKAIMSKQSSSDLKHLNN
jgi:hypothetical protein